MAVKIAEDKLEELRELSDGNDDLVLELLDKFLDSTPKLVQQARKAIEENNEQQIDYCVHTMKGSCLSLGLEPMADYLVELNKKTKQGDLSQISSELDQVEKYIEEVGEYRKQLG